MEHNPAHTVPWEPAPPEHFTGRVWFAALAPPVHEAALNTLGVTFEPGARTAWHRHPDGQVLYIVAGTGIVAEESGERARVGAGDVVVTPPGEIHWHGAAPDGFMTHLSLTTGGPTEWLGRHVTDAEYAGPD